MKYFHLFETHAEHEAARVAMEKLELYLSYCEDKKDVTLFYLKKSKYAVGDYLLSSMQVVKNADITNEQKSNVIGVCVIPDNFIGLSGENAKARFCALRDVDTSYETTYWGKTGEDLSSYTNFPGYYTHVPCVGTIDKDGNLSTGTMLSNSLKACIHNYGYALTEKSFFISNNISYINGVAKYDILTTYYNTTSIDKSETTHDGTGAAIPSPYLYETENSELKYNSIYGSKECSDGTYDNMLSDFNGKENTEWLCNLMGTAHRIDWNTVKNSSIQYTGRSSLYFEAAARCYIFNTNGTNRTDWYLPAIGELAFILSRLQTILNAITKVNGTTFRVTGNSYYWSSTLYSAGYACNIEIMICTVSRSASICRARPFLRLD